MSNKINKAFNLPSTSNEVNTNAFSSNDNYFIAPEKCKPKQIPFKMECINKFDLLCSIYTGETFSDYGIKTGDSGNVVLEKIIQNLNKDEEDIPTVTKTSQLVNDGDDGEDPYATLSQIPTPYTLPIASATVLGGFKVGSGLSINPTTGVLSSTTYTLPTASTTVLGGIKVGSNLSIDSNGVLSASATPYTLPTASATVLGGVKVGANLSINASTGVLSATATPQVQTDWNATTGLGVILNKPTSTSDFINDGEDGVSPYTTENHVSINYLRYDRANTVVSNRFNIHSDYGNHSGFNFDYDYPQMFYGTNYLRMTDDSFLDIRVGAGVGINAPYLSINGEIYASAHVASSLFKFTNATTGTVTTPRTLHTDGTNVKYTGNDGVPRDLAFASDIKTNIFNPPTLAQLTALNIKRGDFYKDINTGQIALFDGEQLTEWIITSVTQWNSLTPEQKAAVKIFSYQKDE